MTLSVLAHFLDIILFCGAIIYGFIQDGQPDYKQFNTDKSHIYFFRTMLVLTLFLYSLIAYVGGASGIGFKVYCTYIVMLLVAEDIIYSYQIVLLVSMWGLIVIETIRELLLILAGFWRF